MNRQDKQACGCKNKRISPLIQGLDLAFLRRVRCSLLRALRPRIREGRAGHVNDLLLMEEVTAKWSEEEINGRSVSIYRMTHLWSCSQYDAYVRNRELCSHLQNHWLCINKLKVDTFSVSTFSLLIHRSCLYQSVGSTKSLITCPAKTSPATAGTKATLPGVARRPVGSSVGAGERAGSVE